jgi:hypothetical protein
MYRCSYSCTQQRRGGGSNFTYLCGVGDVVKVVVDEDVRLAHLVVCFTVVKALYIRGDDLHTFIHVLEDISRGFIYFRDRLKKAGEFETLLAWASARRRLIMGSIKNMPSTGPSHHMIPPNTARSMRVKRPQLVMSGS